MMDVAELEYLPPDAGTPYRQAVNEWAAMYDRPVGADINAPNYARWLAALTAGLMQSKPPTVEGQMADATATASPLAELVEESTETAAGLGVVYLRPVWNGEAWGVQGVPPTRCAPVWQHRRLTEALVWAIYPDPRDRDNKSKRVALVEHWHTDGVDWWVVAGETGAHMADRLKVNDVWPLDAAPDTVTAELPGVDAAGEDRERFAETGDARLSAFVWKWTNGQPAPIYATNEGSLQGLVRLWDQEQVDAELTRNRMVVDQSFLQGSAGQIVGPDGGVVSNVARAMDANVYAVKSATAGAQGVGADRLFEVVTFPDDTVMRDRIERRENTMLEVVGINPQSVGRSVGGRSDSAAAKRADQQMTLNTVANPALRLQTTLSEAMTQVNVWNGAGELVVTVTPGPKPIPAESAELAGSMRAADGASTETVVATIHPEWDAEQVAAEVARIAAEGVVAMGVEGGSPFVPDDASSIVG